jgi:hyperosmotically inducible periplasmic protein
MSTLKTPKTLAFAILLGTSMIGVQAQSTDPQTKPPDNSAVNKRDQAPGAVTADQQKMNKADREMTAQIRKSIMADKSLSTYAHNIKVITQDGTVTLKGPVRSDDEAKAIVAKATEVTGSPDKVVNQLEVKPKTEK